MITSGVKKEMDSFIVDFKKTLCSFLLRFLKMAQLADRNLPREHCPHVRSDETMSISCAHEMLTFKKPQLICFQFNISE